MLKSSLSRWFAALVFVLAIGAIAFALNMRGDSAPVAKVVREDKKSDSGGATIAPPAAVVSIASMPPSEEDAKANFSLDWYEAPIFADAEKYAASPSSIEWDASCKGHPLAAKHDDLNRLIRARMGINGEAQFPRDVNIEEISQFWQDGKTFYQISASWEQSSPATYRIEYYSSETSDFSFGVKSLPAPEREHLSVSAALKLISESLAGAKAHGAKEGSRILLASVASTKPDGEPHRARFLNSRPTEYSSEDIECRLDRTHHRSQCRCLNAREVHQ